MILQKPASIKKLSLLKQFKLVKLARWLAQSKAQSKVDGHHNCWIVKPSYNARGHGIFCSSSLKEILAKQGKQTIVQKYVETPLLLDK